MLLPETNAEMAASALKALKQVALVEAAREGNMIRLTVLATGGGEISDTIGDIAAVSNWQVSQYTVDPGRLDDVFRQLTERDGK